MCLLATSITLFFLIVLIYFVSMYSIVPFVLITHLVWRRGLAASEKSNLAILDKAKTLFFKKSLAVSTSFSLSNKGFDLLLKMLQKNPQLHSINTNAAQIFQAYYASYWFAVVHCLFPFWTVQGHFHFPGFERNCAYFWQIEQYAAMVDIGQTNLKSKWAYFLL